MLCLKLIVKDPAMKDSGFNGDLFRLGVDGSSVGVTDNGLNSARGGVCSRRSICVDLMYTDLD